MSRSFYSIFAAFHAWLEVPVLLALFSYNMSSQRKLAAMLSQRKLGSGNIKATF